MNRTWWKEAVVYQVYPRSFKDSNGDGVGDIPGIIEKLDYIKSLGVDVIWICPLYKSPNDDNGYDISDYCSIHEDFGTIEDFDRLLEGIHSRGMRLLMDLVVNHTSDEHEWFQESRKSKHNPKRDYYIWKPGKGEGPPNNWRSFFGGSAWEYDAQTDEYYLHLFTKKQPDLNWENPAVRKEVGKLMEFWLEKGIDGFRMDVISVISKKDFKDSPYEDFTDTIENVYANGPRIHQYLKELNRNVLCNYDIMTVGEGPGINLEHGINYVAKSERELDMIFHFDHMFIDQGPGGKFDVIPLDFIKFKDVFSLWDKKLKDEGWGSIFLGNHDFSRIVSRFGNDGVYWEKSAKLLALMMQTLRGTVYVYQGEEIGMTNVAFDDISDYNDVETLNAYREWKEQGRDMGEFMKAVHKQGRDNTRTPMQWDHSLNAGFTNGTPWLKINPNYREINVASQQNDEQSILNFYRKLIRVRKEHLTLVYGDYAIIQRRHPQVYAYWRWSEEAVYLILLNFSGNDISFGVDGRYEISGCRPIIGNYGEPLAHEGKVFNLRPWEAILYQV